MAKMSGDYQIPDVGAVMSGMTGRGVKVKAILDSMTLNIGVDHAIFESQDGKYSACLTLKQAEDFGILLYEKDGEPFPVERGGPFRLVAPGLGDLCANVKQVGRVMISKGVAPDTRPPEACAEEA